MRANDATNSWRKPFYELGYRVRVTPGRRGHEVLELFRPMCVDRIGCC